MAQLTIYVPSLFLDVFEHTHANVDPQRWPVVALLCARARVAWLENNSGERVLLSLCGVNAQDLAEVSVAALTRLIDFDDVAPGGMFRADPVHLRADPNQILLFNDPSIMPSAAEADALLETLNLGLPGLNFGRGRHPGRWYFRPVTGAITTTSPQIANGRSVTELMPRGEAAGEFAQLMNDSQMLLHDTSVNQERESRGAPVINSIWPWGGGRSDRPAVVYPDLLVGDDVLLAGIARKWSTDWIDAIEPDELLTRLVREKGNGLVLFGSPNGCLEDHDPVAGIEDFERQWGSVLLNALRRFRLRELRIVTDRHCYRITPWDLLKIWRKPSPVSKTNCG
jgi:hypothetical protein